MSSPVNEFEIPPRVILDSQSGYAVNIPLYRQFQFPQDVPPDLLARIMEQRRLLDITITDWIPDFEMAENNT